MQQSSKFVVSCLDEIGPQPGAKAVDGPCGFGRHSVELRNRGYIVTALDLDQQRIAVVEAELRRFSDNGSMAAIADLEKSAAVSLRSFDVALVVDYASEAGLRTMLTSVRTGGYIVIETFRAHGENWRELPAAGLVHALLAGDFVALRYHERPAGPTNTEAVSVRCLGRRHA